MVGLNDAICLTDSFVFTPCHFLYLKGMRYESAGLNKSHHVTLVLRA